MMHNLAQCRSVIQKAVAGGAKALFLPEASDYIGGSTDETLALCRPASQSPFILGLQEDAKENALPISVGVHEPSDDPQSKRIKNTLLWIDENGEIGHRYQKVHMFDLDLPGGPTLKESDVVEPGKHIAPPFDTVLGKIGAMICFDLRFPEISLALKRQNADILLYPSAFTVPTGKAHWMPLLQARAIECQAYVIAAAQAGAHNAKRTSYGHSVIINPWGEVVAELGGDSAADPEVAFAEIDLDHVKQVRRNLPLLRHTWVFLLARRSCEADILQRRLPRGLDAQLWAYRHRSHLSSRSGNLRRLETMMSGSCYRSSPAAGTRLDGSSSGGTGIVNSDTIADAIQATKVVLHAELLRALGSLASS